MNIDKVPYINDCDSQLANYGEPNPAEVYKAAFSIQPSNDNSLQISKSIIEEMNDELWEVLSLEHGEELLPLSYWACSDYVGNATVEELHDKYEEALNIFRYEYRKREIRSMASSEPRGN